MWGAQVKSWFIPCNQGSSSPNDIHKGGELNHFAALFSPGWPPFFSPGCWEPGWIQRSRISGVSRLSSGERKERFGAMGMPLPYIPYWLGSSLELFFLSFHTFRGTQNRWFMMENPTKIWMIWGTPGGHAGTSVGSVCRWTGWRGGRADQESAERNAARQGLGTAITLVGTLW